MKIDVILTIDVEDTIDFKDPFQKMWLYNTVLDKDQLHLHSNEIGEEVGRIVEIHVVDEIK